MIFMTEKQFEMREREERKRFYRRLDELDRQICELRVQLHDLKKRVDPEHRRLNTPVCVTEVQCGDHP